MARDDHVHSDYHKSTQCAFTEENCQANRRQLYQHGQKGVDGIALSLYSAFTVIINHRGSHAQSICRMWSNETCSFAVWIKYLQQMLSCIHIYIRNNMLHDMNHSCDDVILSPHVARDRSGI